MIHSLHDAWSYLADTPLFWLGFTLMVYLFAVTLYQRSNGHPLLLPVLLAVVLVIAFLYATGTPYQVYARHTWLLQFLIGPATVALAIPLYSQLGRLKRYFWPVMVALLAGSACAIVSALGIAWLMGATELTQLSLLPKSATMPIAMEVSALSGGIPSLTTVAVALTGISGAMLAGFLLKMLKADDSVTQGFSLGLTAHAIGVARAFQIDETAGAFAALGMGLNGIATAVLVPVLLSLLALF